MNITPQLAHQVLEALEAVTSTMTPRKHNAAIIALREALSATPAQPTEAPEDCDCRDTLLWAISTPVQITAIEYGSEPTLRDVLFSYYARSGMDAKEAERCTGAYITALFAAFDAALSTEGGGNG